MHFLEQLNGGGGEGVRRLRPVLNTPLQQLTHNIGCNHYHKHNSFIRLLIPCLVVIKSGMPCVKINGLNLK